MIWNLFKQAAFCRDAELVHNLSGKLMRYMAASYPGLVKFSCGTHHHASDSFELLGQSFHNRIGLAAGFDKNAELIPALALMGFGFVEIGTVTPRPQQGNPKPRLFRIPEDRNLFNAMGFNNDGAEIVSERLRSSRSKLPPIFRIGVNVGKNKDTPNEKAAEDYSLAASYFRDLADYMVVNVSSPNTSGLRDLQTVSQLEKIIGAVKGEISQWRKRPPLFVKIAPELEGKVFDDLMKWISEADIEGLVLTNTLAGVHKNIAGGFSGAALTELSLNRLRQARKTLAQKPIISVGGIMSEFDARLRIQAGASLLQTYTGWIYGGPRFPQLLVEGIRGL